MTYWVWISLAAGLVAGSFVGYFRGITVGAARPAPSPTAQVAPGVQAKSPVHHQVSSPLLIEPKTLSDAVEASPSENWSRVIGVLTTVRSTLQDLGERQTYLGRKLDEVVAGLGQRIDNAERRLMQTLEQVRRLPMPSAVETVRQEPVRREPTPSGAVARALPSPPRDIVAAMIAKWNQIDWDTAEPIAIAGIDLGDGFRLSMRIANMYHLLYSSRIDVRLPLFLFPLLRKNSSLYSEQFFVRPTAPEATKLIAPAQVRFADNADNGASLQLELESLLHPDVGLGKLMVVDRGQLA